MKRLLAVLLALGACGEASKNAPDPYYGTVDTTAFDTRFVPSTNKTSCPNGACYPYQLGYEGGNQIHFFNFGATPTKNFPVDQAGATQIPVAVANSAYQFAECTPRPYDTFADSFDPSVQFPIFAKLPLATTNTKAFLLPLAAVYAVDGVTGENCNDLKNASSIGPQIGPAGKFGAQASNVVQYHFWAPIDMTAQLPATSQLCHTPGQVMYPPNTPVCPGGWYKGLQFEFLDGGQVPVDSSGMNLAYMDGAILDAGAGSFTAVTAQNAVVLPHKPGDPGYSPIMRLFDYVLPAGYALGDGTLWAICTSQASCTAPECPIQCSSATCAGPSPGGHACVDISAITAAPFNTIFVIWSDQ
jgi:hypothetical protein